MSGFDWILIDTEHGFGGAASCCTSAGDRAAQRRHRARAGNDAIAFKQVSIGPSGIMVPGVNSAAGRGRWWTWRASRRSADGACAIDPRASLRRDFDGMWPK